MFSENVHFSNGPLLVTETAVGLELDQERSITRRLR